MIEIQNITKKFENLTALSEVSATVEEGHVFGLIGTNGAGKSTLLRTVCGIYAPDEGQVLIDGLPVYENPEAKAKIFYISDDQYFFPNGTPLDMARFYQTVYPAFQAERFDHLMSALKLDKKQKINTFSKGMKKQLSVMLGICSGTKYLLCDETFDGLDPVIRQAIKRLFIREMEENGLTPIIASMALISPPDTAEAFILENWYYLSDYFITIHAVLQMVIIFSLAIMLSEYGFRHLYSRKTADLYHSMPVTRDQCFLAYWLSGFLIWFVPFLVGDIIVYVMTMLLISASSQWVSVTLLFLAQLALFMLCFLIIYNACLVAVMVSGNLSSATVNLLLYGLIVVSSYSIIYGYLNCYFESFVYEENPILESMICGFTPFYSAIQLCVAFAENTLLSEWGGALALSVICMVLNFLLAMYLHRKRPSELAERGLENKCFAIPFRFVGSCLAGLFLSLLFVGSDGGWCIFWALFGTVFTFAILNIVYHTSFKMLFCHKRQLGLAVLLTCGTVLFFAFDLLGYDAYMPNKEDITGLSLQASSLYDTGYLLSKTAEGNYTRISPGRIPGEPMFDNQEEIYHLLQAMTTPYTSEEPYAIQRVSVRVFTKTGEYRRNYTLYMEEENRELIRPFIESESYQEYFYPASTGQMEPPAEISVTSLDNVSFTITDSTRINAIYEAYSRDFKEHYSMDMSIGSFDFVDMHYRYPKNNDGGMETVSLKILPWHDHTLALLEKWSPGLYWTTDDLTFHSLCINLPDISIMSTPSNMDDPMAGTMFYKTQSGDITIDDPETLKKLQPRLKVSKHKVRNLSPKYVYIGTLDVTAGTSEHGTYHGYMEYDAIPEELSEIMGIKE